MRIYTSCCPLHFEQSLIIRYIQVGNAVAHRTTGAPKKNLQSWTVMISCLANNGRGEEALSLFARMELAGFTPDSVLFSIVLSACSHRGPVSKGAELYEKMVDVYRIDPPMEPYGCVVDLLGRVGRIEEAYQVITSMPMEPHSVILSYLSACKQHGFARCLDERLMGRFDRA